MSDIRFIDSVNVGAYPVDTEISGSALIVLSGSSGNIFTATGNDGVIQGQEEFVIQNGKLGVNNNSPSAVIDVSGSISSDILLITSYDQNGIKVNSAGTLQLLEYDTLPTAISGGIAYSSSTFFLGL